MQGPRQYTTHASMRAVFNYCNLQFVLPVWLSSGVDGLWVGHRRTRLVAGEKKSHVWTYTDTRNHLKRTQHSRNNGEAANVLGTYTLTLSRQGLENNQSGVALCTIIPRLTVWRAGRTISTTLQIM